jgi:hypothetical protein
MSSLTATSTRKSSNPIGLTSARIAMRNSGRGLRVQDRQGEQGVASGIASRHTLQT